MKKAGSAEATDSQLNELELRKEAYMKHFMIDFIEHGLSQVLQQNALHCAK